MKHFQDYDDEYDPMEEYESGSLAHHKAKLYKEEDE